MAFSTTPIRSLSRGLMIPAVIGVAVTAGFVGSTGLSLFSIVVLALAVATTALTFMGKETPRAWAHVLGGLLIGYAFIGRGFAHLGVPPVFVGEVAFALGLVAFAMRGWRHRLRPVEWLLIAFIVWGIVTTFPYVQTYGVDSIRDAALWGYAVFALIVSALVRTRASLERIVIVYAATIPFFLLWLPFGKFIPRLMGGAIPQGLTGVPILTFKDGDMAVHLVAVAAFALGGLFAAYSRNATFRNSAIFWTFWLFGMVLTFRSRGAMLSIATGLFIVLLFRPSGRLVPLGLIAAFLLSLAILFNPSIEGGGGRQISARQVVPSVLSIFQDDVAPEFDGTRRWRLEWWDKIYNYTVVGPYFWTGKGFGINLAVDDGFDVGDGVLRSPHNGHLTVLARMGVPGVGLWAAVHLAFGLAMLSLFRRASRAGDHLLSGVALWVMVFWAASMMNGAFDVYLEGPQGAIWTWSMIGIGIAAARLTPKTVEEEQ
jgi:O-antigen ligase/polysaccharide polymerase Wzy-like membrane protein